MQRCQDGVTLFFRLDRSHPPWVPQATIFRPAGILQYSQPGRLDGLCKRCKDGRKVLQRHGEACQLISAVKATAKIPGDMAEAGVAYGASASLTADHAPESMFWTVRGAGAIITLRFCFVGDKFEDYREPRAN